jgi:hypothetical protein
VPELFSSNGLVLHPIKYPNDQSLNSSFHDNCIPSIILIWYISFSDKHLLTPSSLPLKSYHPPLLQPNGIPNFHLLTHSTPLIFWDSTLGVITLITFYSQNFIFSTILQLPHIYLVKLYLWLIQRCASPLLVPTQLTMAREKHTFFLAG